MATRKVAITMEARLLEQLDRMVRAGVFPNRSQAIQAAVAEKLERLTGDRLATECAKLDPAFEQAMAGEGLPGDVGAWPVWGGEDGASGPAR